MKSFHYRLALSLLGLIIMLCCSCETAEQTVVAPAAKPEVSEPQPGTEPAELPPAVKAVAEPTNIVAKIGDYAVTIKEFNRRLISELHHGRGGYTEKVEPVDPETLLMEMIAEKAMVMDAREKNYLENERIRALLREFKQEKLTALLLTEHLEGKVTVTDAEVDEKIKTDPKPNRAGAEIALKRAKSAELINQLYSQICEKFHVKKLSENFPAVVEIHQRLLLYPKKPRRARWIRNSQVREELTPEEKNLALASYDGGAVTLQDWFKILCNFSPPSRPKDLNTTKGVERLLDMAMRRPLFTVEALSRGLHNNEDYRQKLKEREDLLLFNMALTEKTKDIRELQTEAEILDYFNKNKQAFRIPDALKIDQIWCQNLETARRARAELDSNPDFKSVKQKYSLEVDEEPFATVPLGEGIFFEDLWNNSKPNEIIGPIKGFHGDRVLWRIVKILEKRPGQPQEYSDNLEGNVKSKAYEEQREVLLAEYRKELLEKYPYQIYAERITEVLCASSKCRSHATHIAGHISATEIFIGLTL